MATPIFEFTEVFARPIGEHTDIVAKEMYTFTDRGGEEVTLRPENTAGVVRAVLSNGLTQSTPLKFFYTGPMFRYERPQKGRFRQFHQIGVELLGVAQPQADIEVIALGRRILNALGIGDRVVLDSTPWDPESRAAYREALVAYFLARLADLSEDRRNRLERNPLRILDSKIRATAASSPTRRISPITSTPHRRISSPGCAAGWTGLASATRSIRGWCAASITTPTPRSNSSRPTLARRDGDGRRPITTAWSRRWAGRRCRGSAGPRGSSGSRCLSRSRRCPGARLRWCRSARLPSSACW